MNRTIRIERKTSASQTTFPGPNFVRILNSERIKSLSLTSTRGLFLSVLIMLAAAAALRAIYVKGHGHNAITDLSAIPVAGFIVVTRVLTVFGALLATSEFTIGTSRTTFAVAPSRWPVLAAKAAYGAFASFAIAYAVAFLSGFGALPVLGGFASLDMASWDIQGPMIFSAVIAAAFTLIGLGAGMLLRNSVGSILALLSVLTIVPAVVQWLSVFEGSVGELFRQVYRYLPDSAANGWLQAGSIAAHSPRLLEPEQGAFVLAAYVITFLACAFAALRRRDL